MFNKNLKYFQSFKIKLKIFKNKTERHINIHAACYQRSIPNISKKE